ncbi:putative late blight resistance protein homolog R1A-3 [Coffea eugenioides]|uniref:putative late blight resistance protein homolog R1A-3 n=1 Tax=Coffea eugenioides TaxID=49369 RepID=UPI000F6145B7|nr:putative late blight resistance protein homolog R1A-3 [Coffea eugenioides]
MEISSSSSISCFDSALEYLDWFSATFRCLDCDDIIDLVELGVRVLQSFDLYLTKCRRRRRNLETCLEQDEEEKDVTSFRIQNLIIRRMQDLEFACSEHLIHSRLDGLTQIRSELTRFQVAIKLFFETYIKESCINFLLEYYWLRDPELVIDFVDSASKTLAELPIYCFKHLVNKLMFMKSFIRFAMLRGIKGQQLIDLLIHAEVVAINALRLASIWCFDSDRHNGDVQKEMRLQISRLIREKINPGDPQVRETYIHVLTAAKLSRSSDISDLEKNKHPVADFMDRLVHNIKELLKSCTNILVPIMNQMLKLLEGLRFLTILLKHQEKFKELCHEMKNLIGVVACDAAVVIFSLSVNQIKEGLAKETDLALFHLLKVIKFLRAEVTNPVTSFSPFGFPRTNEMGSVDFLLENLKELEICNEADDSIAFPKDQIHTVLEDLVFLRSFLVKIADQRNWNGKLQALWSRVMEVAHRAEFVIDSIVVGDKHEYLERVARDIQLLRTEAFETYDSTKHDCGAQRTNQKSFRIESKCSTPVLNEALVGLDDEVKTIIHSLTRGSKLLDFVSIVGMAGLGKTTLANRVYNDPLILSYFHIRAQCTVAQVYNMHSLLVKLLCSISSRSPDEYLEMGENDLAHKLYKLLKGNRYLIFLDDMWEIKAWNLVKSSLPNDANGSRILVTSRIQLQFKPDSKAYHLRHLTDNESWKLLQKKLFGKEGFPPILGKVGSQIAKLCRGLPLTVVLVAGILANTAEDCWEEVAKSLTSSIVLHDEYCMKTLELSYNHLPDDLKPCLLYFGAFQEDENVPVRRLLWLWISEGFVRKTEGKRLEDVADDYLRDLVDRSLVMVSKQRSTGGAKACRLHDLVHEFCVKKAKEENLLHIVHGQSGRFILTGPSNPLRVCDQNTKNLMIWELMLEFPNVRSLLLFKEDDLGFWLLKLLRVLDLRKLVFRVHFPMEVLLLVHLRYLALCTRGVNFIPAAIANLSRLQTFLLRGNNADCFLPKTIWNIKTLRHLWTTNSAIGFMFPVENLEVSPGLDRLDTLSLAIDPSSQNLQKTLAKLPNIRRLRCNMRKSREEATRIGNGILGFDCLNQLESLTLRHFCGFGLKFPLNLKKLTLSYHEQPWSEISTIGKLSSLEVLKLLDHSFFGGEWEMNEGEFLNLRVLKLSRLRDFHSWTASSDNFPRIEKLVVDWCPNLEEVPSCLGECLTLEMIDVKWCGESVASSVKQIQQDQIDTGNEVLKISIEPCGDARSSSEEEEEEEESSPPETELIPSKGV